MDECKLCSQKGTVIDRGHIIICPMCKGSGKTTEEDIDEFFNYLMKRKSMYYVKRKNKTRW